MKLSVIIPVYNMTRYLRECLDSVAAQSYPDWEAICIDDGSTDDSGAILDEYVAKDPRFRVIHKKNAGVPSARNDGIAAAQGEWVAFIDSDDSVKSEWFAHAAALMTDDVDLVRPEPRVHGRRHPLDEVVPQPVVVAELVGVQHLARRAVHAHHARHAVVARLERLALLALELRVKADRVASAPPAAAARRNERKAVEAVGADVKPGTIDRPSAQLAAARPDEV